MSARSRRTDQGDLLPPAVRFIRETDHDDYRLVRTVIRAGAAALRSRRIRRADERSSNLTARTQWGEAWITFGPELGVTLIRKNSRNAPQFSLDPPPGGSLDLDRPLDAAVLLDEALTAYDACALVDGSLNDHMADSPTAALINQVVACYQAAGGTFPASMVVNPPGPFLFPTVHFNAAFSREWTGTLDLARLMARTIPSSAQFTLSLTNTNQTHSTLSRVRLGRRREFAIRLDRPLDPVELVKRVRAYDGDPAQALKRSHG